MIKCNLWIFRGITKRLWNSSYFDNDVKMIHTSKSTRKRAWLQSIYIICNLLSVQWRNLNFKVHQHYLSIVMVSEFTLEINFWHFSESHFTLVIGCDFLFKPDFHDFCNFTWNHIEISKISLKIAQDHWNWIYAWFIFSNTTQAWH